MRNSVVLRLAGAAALAIMAGSVISSPAVAFVGLSDRQSNEITKYIKCKTYLLKADLASFEADRDCGNGRVSSQARSPVETSGPPASPKKREHCYEWPSEGMFAISISEGGGSCYPTYSN